MRSQGISNLINQHAGQPGAGYMDSDTTDHHLFISYPDGATPENSEYITLTFCDDHGKNQVSATISRADFITEMETLNASVIEGDSTIHSGVIDNAGSSLPFMPPQAHSVLLKADKMPNGTIQYTFTALNDEGNAIYVVSNAVVMNIEPTDKENFAPETLHAFASSQDHFNGYTQDSRGR